MKPKKTKCRRKKPQTEYPPIPPDAFKYRSYTDYLQAVRKYNILQGCTNKPLAGSYGTPRLFDCLQALKELEANKNLYDSKPPTFPILEPPINDPRPS
jgi:hypothetical protein